MIINFWKIFKYIFIFLLFLFCVLFLRYLFLELNIKTIPPENRHFIQIEDVNLSYGFIDNKSEKNVVVVGGTSANFDTWNFILEKLDKNYNYYVLDLPPFGYTEIPEEFNFEISYQSNILNEFIIKQNLQHITLLAHSFGNILTLETFLKSPNKFDKFIIVDGASILKDKIKTEKSKLLEFVFGNKILSKFLSKIILNFKYGLKLQLQSLVFDKNKITDFWVNKYFEQSNYKNNSINFLKWFDNFIFAGQENLLQQNENNFKNINTPVYIIWGEKDKITPIEQGNKIHTLFKGSNMINIKNVGHMPMIENETEFENILNMILK
jgi:pimeloyl-ACP methyl ester carboxylesterase